MSNLCPLSGLPPPPLDLCPVPLGPRPHPDPHPARLPERLVTYSQQRFGLTPTPLPTVEGGHRAIFFNRIGGVQQDTILAEGLHFR